jgi:NAD(P)-dependent dehydrogenase (short-subunit alcohol dehydrogenase family)
MTGLMDGEVAVVTGGASGNGRSIALTFAREGADVVVADIREDPREGGQPTHEKITDEYDARAGFVECDVTDVADLRTAVEAADEFGGVTSMVNNAGVLTRHDFLEATEEEYDRIFEINSKGTYFGAQAAARAMVEADRSGSIVNISSIAAINGTPSLSAYSASKGAVRLLTYALAGELGPHGIRVNAVHPGPIETTMATQDVPLIPDATSGDYAERNPLGRAGYPEDVANACLFLASDLSAWVNGESLVLDGGLHAINVRT